MSPLHTKISILCICIASLASCDKKKAVDDKVDINSAIAHADSIFEMRDSVRAFATQINSKELLEVVDLNNWPDSLSVIYNVCYDNGALLLYKEIPQIESGDYSIYYTYYAKDNAFYALDVESRFFDENCSESAIIEDKLYVISNNQLTLKKYSLVNVEGESQDSTSCSFGRPIEIPRYQTFANTPISRLIVAK